MRAQFMPQQPPIPHKLAKPNERACRVLRAATRVFLAYGFSAASTDTIQREAGVSKATVYAHFTSKEALFKAVIESECEAFARTAENMSFEPGDIGRTLTTLGRSYLRIVLSPNALALFRVVVAEAPRFPELARTFYMGGPDVVIGLVARQLAKAADAGEVNVSLVGMRTAAALFASLLRGDAQMQCLTDPRSSPSETQLDGWVEAAVTTFLGAYGP